MRRFPFPPQYGAHEPRARENAPSRCRRRPAIRLTSAEAAAPRVAFVLRRSVLGARGTLRARERAVKSPLALQIGKEGINRLHDIPYHQGLDVMDDLFATLCSTEDAVEGVNAFLAKRPPEWKNR